VNCVHIKIPGSHQEIARDFTYGNRSVYAEGTFLIRRTGADHAVLTTYYVSKKFSLGSDYICSGFGMYSYIIALRITVYFVVNLRN
jgi:hypothetical protein